MKSKPKSFAEKVLYWFDEHGRHDFPWQKQRNLYRVWLAEIMLQQTQVKTVIPYYLRFLESYPTLADLSSSTLDKVLNHWAGLGYYSRARNLYSAAIEISIKHKGLFPTSYDDVLALPGIGPSTSGAILAQALNQRHAILDGNVKRVLCRYHLIEGWPGKMDVSQKLWKKAEKHTPFERVNDYTQAIMDLGATLCVRAKPNCELCPLNDDCKAYIQDTVKAYPAKKPKKAMPVKQVQMLVITNEAGAVLLKKRPPSGIWGGLWSLPEIDVSDNVVKFCLEKLAVRVKSNREEEAFRHTFSHYHLDITPSWVLIDDKTDMISDTGDIAWYNKKQLSQIGVPKPVASLLEQTFA